MDFLSFDHLNWYSANGVNDAFWSEGAISVFSEIYFPIQMIPY